MKKRTIFSFTALILCFTLVFQLCSCSSQVLAHDLMDGIERNGVAGNRADNAFLSAQTDFAVQLLSATHKEGENTLISPLSAMLCLAMATNGAGGNSLAQLEKALGGNIRIDELNRYLYEYAKNLPSEKGQKLEIANSIWLRDDLDVKKTFLQINKDYYDAAAYRSVFDSRTLDDINSWVKKNTDGMIEKILEEIDPGAAMYLVNALVFDGQWESKYKKGDVYDAAFTAADGTKQEVEMMKSGESFYLEDDLSTGFMKSYKGSSYCFAAVLPKKGVTPEEYLAVVGSDGLRALLTHSENTHVEACLPKFEAEYTASLIDPLRTMGVMDIFDDRADLSGIAEADLYVSEIIHKTFLALDEDGTKAAAVTSAGIKEMSLSPSGKSVVLDRPFLYLILHRETCLPVFIGIANSMAK